MPIPFNNTYANLPDGFFKRVTPTPVAAPKLIAYNHELAAELGIDDDFIKEESALDIFAGNQIPEGAEPLAMVYSGHQFGGFSPVLGDGRAILLGEVVDINGIRRDIQLKGAGATPFSRRGDGRSALGPVLREYIVSEAMAALGIPTTRALAAVASGEQVVREAMEPGGVFTRVAKSHLRIGTTQYFAAHEEHGNLEKLISYSLQRHYPEKADSANPALALLESVIEAQAALIAKWMGVGFIHGVMNTDNMSLSGETIDYGPCAFLDEYDPAKKFSYIDRGGRYAFANQPSIAHWNLTRLAEAILPFISKEQEKAIELAESALEKFPKIFEALYIGTFCRKAGLTDGDSDNWALLEEFLELMNSQKVDFTLCFRHLSTELAQPESPQFLSLFSEQVAIENWLIKWRERLTQQGIKTEESLKIMKESNPIFIPRNHRLEEVIRAGKNGDFAPFHRLNKVLSNPFTEQPDASEFELPPTPAEVVPATFCGT
ncbi:MAG: YdiU family protein [Verrucomicrobiales bacterium]|nr:YdiU family protein [Verrucomicrobiales bacterium]